MVLLPKCLLLQQVATHLILPLCVYCLCFPLSFSTLFVTALACEKGCSLKASQQAAQPSSSSSPSSSHPHSHSHLPVASIAIGAFSCGVVACILLLAALSFFLRRWRNRHTQNQLPAAYNIYTSAEENIPPIRRFTMKELLSSTSNFCYQLGRKPNSSIFKGWVDGMPVAVKRVDSKGGPDGFLASVYQASCVNHPNLVKLLGFCLEGSEMMLVYEYLEAGSLDTVLMKSAEALDWDTRYSIAMKVAQTLLFLHEECGDCLAHGNVKLENIMLGDDWCPKLADFGLADLCIRDKIAALKQAKDGANAANLSPNLSNGNVSPTWLSGFRASAATDVYGFGLVLLSLILGRGNIVDALAASTDPIFLEWIYLQAKQGMYEDALDSRLLLEANPKEVRVALQLAFCCMQDNTATRPVMQKVWQVLRDREELGLPLLSALAFGCNVSTESDRNSEDPGDHVLVLDVEKDKESGSARNKEEIEPCYQVFSMRWHRRSVSSVSSV